MTTNDTDRAAYISGLRAVADWLAAHPEVPLPYLGDYAKGSSLPSLPIYLYDAPGREQLAAIARAMADGGTATKAVQEYRDGDSKVQVWREFDGIVVFATIAQSEVCERVVTGTETVTRTVPDPTVEVPMVEVTETVETVEWRCRPILADADTTPAVTA